MVGAAIKGVSKLLKRRKTIGGSKATKKKPTPRYRKDPKTGQKFLNRRATVSGTKSQIKKPIDGGKASIIIGGAAGAGTAYGISKTDKFKKTAKKLKEATDKIKDKDKKKKEKRKDNQRQK